MTWRDRVRPFSFRDRSPLRRALFLVFLAGPVLLAAPQEQRPAPDLPVFDRETPDRYAADVPAHIAIVDGAATLERDGRLETAEENTPLLAGDRLRTQRGRIEVQYEDGSVVDVDQFSRLDFMSDTLLRLMAGRVRLSIARAATPLQYRVDLAGVSAFLQDAGEYRIGIRDARDAAPEVELTVLRGVAELETPQGKSRVRSGQQVSATATSLPSVPQVVNVSSIDEFDRWVEDQREARLGPEPSANYLPEEVSSYGGTLDSAGDWDYLPSYGQVWYPNVAADWRPYSVGRWSFYGSFGWTWVGGPRWAWPTHHYGRWGYGPSNRWYWIPGHQWGPAWVSWGHTPSYVSWCPLGYNGRPVFGLTNVSYIDPWIGWTVVPAHSFRSRLLRLELRGRAADAHAGDVVAVRRARHRTIGAGDGSLPASADSIAVDSRPGGIA